MSQTAQQYVVSDCVPCVPARPHLGNVPFRLNRNNNPKSLKYVLQLFPNSSLPNDTACHTHHYLFPAVKPQILPDALMQSGNQTSFTRAGEGRNLGKLEWCNTAINITSDANFYKACWFLNYATGRADIWWLCGNKKLRAKLPAEWKGTCALAYLVMPFTVLPGLKVKTLASESKRSHTIHRK